MVMLIMECSKAMTLNKLNLWQKIQLYFHWCPIHGGWLMTWSSGKYKCIKGKETYYN